MDPLPAPVSRAMSKFVEDFCLQAVSRQSKFASTASVSAVPFHMEIETKAEPAPKLDDFDVLRVLGQGGMSTVYLCSTRSRNGTQFDPILVALKVQPKMQILELGQLGHVLVSTAEVTYHIDASFLVGV